MALYKAEVIVNVTGKATLEEIKEFLVDAVVLDLYMDAEQGGLTMNSAEISWDKLEKVSKIKKA